MRVKKFSDSKKRQILTFAKEAGVQQAAKKFGVTGSAIYNWRKEVEICGPSLGVDVKLHDEITSKNDSEVNDNGWTRYEPTRETLLVLYRAKVEKLQSLHRCREELLGIDTRIKEIESGGTNPILRLSQDATHVQTNA